MHAPSIVGVFGRAYRCSRGRHRCAQDRNLAGHRRSLCSPRGSDRFSSDRKGVLPSGRFSPGAIDRTAARRAAVRATHASNASLGCCDDWVVRSADGARLQSLLAISCLQDQEGPKCRPRDGDACTAYLRSASPAQISLRCCGGVTARINDLGRSLRSIRENTHWAARPRTPDLLDSPSGNAHFPSRHCSCCVHDLVCRYRNDSSRNRRSRWTATGRWASARRRRFSRGVGRKTVRISQSMKTLQQLGCTRGCHGRDMLIPSCTGRE
jgi:hypothetical protein